MESASSNQHHHENKDVFNLDRWISQMTQISQNVDNIDTDIWVDYLYETTNLFKTMGSAMSIAFSGKWMPILS